MKYKIGDNIKFISEDGRTRYGVINNITPMITTGEVIYDIIDNVHFFTRPINEKEIFLLEEEVKTKNSGDNLEYKGGALRENKLNKIRYDLIPTELLDMLALKYTQGAAVYGVDNWRKGDENFRASCRASAFRHFISWFKGEEDEDHLSACTWNMITYKLLNNNK